MLKLYQGHYTDADFDLLAQITTLEAENAIKERCELVFCNCNNCDCKIACADIKRLAAHILNTMSRKAGTEMPQTTTVENPVENVETRNL